MFVNKWHVAFVPSFLLVQVELGISEQNHIFDSPFIDIKI